MIKNRVFFKLLLWQGIVLTMIGQVLAVQAQANCLIDSASYNQKVNKQAFTIVDTRLKKDYQQYWIEGSLNLPGQQVKTKAFLKTKPLLLMGAGKFNEHLLRLCEQMKNTGFKHVSVLENGLISWQQTLGRVQGKPLQYRQVMQLSNAELFSRRNHPNWQIIGLADTHLTYNEFDKSVGGKILEKALFMNRQAFINNSNKQIRALFTSKDQPRNIVIMGNEDLFAIVKKYKNIEHKRIYFYPENSLYFLQYSQSQLKIANKKNFTLQQPRNCPKR